ncbi:MAG TPA: M73 family metallopeptidase, partial [Firmicutes bacterium]|nr:M73 family metallopeptidase [Bacillota bacterium]
MANPRNTSKKAAGLAITVILLAAMLVISTLALFTSRASVSDNQFETGTVKIALNGGQAVFDGSDTNIEPGHSLKRDFTVENQGTA